MTSYMLRALRRRDRRDRTGRCDITRGTWPDVETVAADVPCKLRPSLQATTEVVSAGDQVALHLYDVGLPYDQEVARDDVITVTKTEDPLLAGRFLTVVEVTTDEWLTSRVVVCKEAR